MCGARTLALCEPLTAGRHDGAVVPGGLAGQVAPGAHRMVFRVVCAAGVFARLPALQPGLPWLFNSYYESFSAFPEKRLRASFSRPGLEEILRYREHVDAAMERLLEREPDPEALRRIELGANHEEQHQELLLTDILNAFFTNPLRPKYREQDEGPRDQRDEEAHAGNPASEFCSLKAGCERLGMPATGSASTTSCRGIACGWSLLRWPSGW